MTATLNHGSARIYQFPLGGRSALARRNESEVQAAPNPASSEISGAAGGGGWYHEAAIQEAKPVRES